MVPASSDRRDSPGGLYDEGMEFFRRAAGAPSKLGVLPGAYHPPTRAHMGLARAALPMVDEVLFVLPRVFPHKQYGRVGFEERLRMVTAATAGEPRYSVATTDGGLFVEIARECRGGYGPAPQLWFLCGSDAAERIVNWDYGEPGAVPRMLDEFGLLVADRDGRYEPPDELRDRIRRLPVEEDLTGVSATEVRNRIALQRPWQHLVPEQIATLVREIYGGS